MVFIICRSLLSPKALFSKSLSGKALPNTVTEHYFLHLKPNATNYNKTFKISKNVNSKNDKETNSLAPETKLEEDCRSRDQRSKSI